MTIILGSTQINKIYLGNTEILKCCLGENVVYEKQVAPTKEDETEITE